MKKSKFYLFIITAALSVQSCTVSLELDKKAKTFNKAAVVTAHPLASKVGVDILKMGGNAIDAAVAVQFALAVVYPNAGNIGGGGFMVYRSSKGEINALDFREKSPEKGHANMYLDKQGNVIEDLSVYGHLSAGVPGSVDGMVEAHKKYGKLDWKTLLNPAIALAEKGFPITKQQAEEFNEYKESFQKYNPSGAPILKTTSWKKGDLFQQQELANTIRRIADQGRDGFYKGITADLIVKEMHKGNGIISYNDLENYKAVWRQPVTGYYRGHKIICMAPPSSGGPALVALLQSVAQYPLGKWGFQSDSAIRVMVEAERRIYADRAKYLGDPDFIRVPVKELTDSIFNSERLKAVNLTKATVSSDVKAAKFPGYESEETTHFNIVDSEGNAVSITTTLNNSYGSRVFVSGAGFILNDEMDDFSVKPGVPNIYGLVGGKANAIEPNKRMLSSMTPTIVEKDGKLFMVVGTPGGSTIMTSVFQTIVNVIDYQQNAQQSVSSPRFHHQWLPDQIDVEKNAITPVVRKSLENAGYKISPRGNIGRVENIIILPNGKLQTGADPRGDDTASGF
ncbi:MULTISPECIES: gamma-glutamyltransferase [unclassified Sphingobacterium]|uniref:gamma-glutamyltransferase n=1 Tax=unclassified Sphingobacterium TaxID=2609468 RepID=UPI001049D185|nr:MULTISPECIES: gamma-glutamyltransferase [unclassified Sphingobacterium]MCS3555239.1 gamma-glutamyltranspeptidase/glutathione hydrolase [Sphingobacterium sp. JUb21]TCR03614.1 gamma-glutamyltranspeptidase/glutathione hydrolase [Sphingobacterium sp. JUb20]